VDLNPVEWLRLKLLPRRNDPGRLRLWPIGWALAACFTATATGLAGLTGLALALLHHPKLPHPPTVSLHDFIGVLQLVFASVAGAGALVALVMAYRRQRVAETTTEHDRSRVLNERFIAVAAQLGDDQAAVRLAGVHAIAGLADDWEENRQTCIDVLCAYLRMPYEPEPGDDAPAQERLAFRGGREVRHTVIRVITGHLRENVPVSWQGLNFDFTGVVFDGGDFTGARFSGGAVKFKGAVFSGGTVSFIRAVFSGGTVSFDGAVFSGGMVSFGGAVFSGGTVSFIRAVFSGGMVKFTSAGFSGGMVSFGGARFSGGQIAFSDPVDWSHAPRFSLTGTPPPGVKLPTAAP
jgi:Pentapeptide repeats (9 copies)